MDRLPIILVGALTHIAGHFPEHVVKLANSLANHGEPVVLVTFHGFPLAPVKLDNRVRLIEVPEKIRHSVIFRVVINKFSATSMISHFVRSMACIWTAGRVPIGNGVRTMHLVDAQPGLALLVFFGNFWKGARIFTTLHFSLHQEVPSEGARNSASSKLMTNRTGILGRLLVSLAYSDMAGEVIRKLLARAGRRNYIAFITYSEHVGASYSKYLRGFRMHNIPVGVDNGNVINLRTRYRENLRIKREPLLLVFGTNHERKDFEIVWKTLSEIQGFYLLFAGKIDHSKGNDPVKLTQKYHMADRVRVIDRYVKDDEIDSVFLSCDVTVLSYTRDFNLGCGVLTVAAQTLTPVIASNVGQLGDFVTKWNLGLLFEPDSAQSLGSSIRQFFSLSPERLEDFRRNLHRFREYYSWDNATSRYIDAYRGG